MYHQICNRAAKTTAAYVRKTWANLNRIGRICKRLENQLMNAMSSVFISFQSTNLLCVYALYQSQRL